MLRALRILFVSIALDKSCSVTIQKSYKIPHAIAVADMPDISNWAQILTTAGSLNLFLDTAHVEHKEVLGLEALRLFLFHISSCDEIIHF